MKYIIIILIMLVVLILLIALYKKIFKENINNALNNKKTLKMPDLFDLVTSYLFLSLVIIFAFFMNESAHKFKRDVSNCESDIEISTIDLDFEYCINKYNNVIFKEEDSALENIINKNSELLNSIENDIDIRISSSFDKVYYYLENNQKTKAHKDLYYLLKIYNNYFQSKYVHIEGLR